MSRWCAGEGALIITHIYAGSTEPGLIQLVKRVMRQNPPCMTVEEVQRLGGLDPVSVKIDMEGTCLSLEKDKDGPEI